MALELNAVSAVVAWTGASSADATIIANGVEARIGQYCNRMTQGVGVGTIWSSGTRTEYLTGELSDGLMLKWTPITAVASVTLITSNGVTSDYTLTDLTVDGIEIADLGTVNARVGRLQLRAGVRLWDSQYAAARTARVTAPNFGEGRNRIKVVYTGGYSTVPDDLKLAALELCKSVYSAKSINATLQSESLGNYSYTNQTGGEVTQSEFIMGNVRDLLQNYRSYANII